MTTPELAHLVKRMRDVQRAYFKGDKSSVTLGTARKLEREVDKALAEVLGGQPSLFAEKGETPCDVS
jgi:hypothetical protein